MFFTDKYDFKEYNRIQNFNLGGGEMSIKRIKLKDRTLPNYTRKEDMFNMITHIVGGGFGVLALILCCVFAVIHRNWWGLAGGAVYGMSMIFLYTMSSVYHGLRPNRAKKVLQVLDHCTIYALIVGSYVPILLTGLREYNLKLTLIMSAAGLVITAVGVTFTAIDYKTYAAISYTGYFLLGWMAIFAVKPILAAFGTEFFIWLLSGGIAYTVGIVFYIIGSKRHYIHGVFHIFILLGSVLQFIAIFKFCI